MRIATFLFAASALVAGCGYTTRTLVPDRYHTIAVPIFANESDRPDLEYEVTQAVVEELQARTNLRVVTEADDPDLVLRGVLRGVDEEILSRRTRQRLRQNAVFVDADVTVTDRRMSVPVVDARRVHEREAFAPAVGGDVRSARAEATRSLAERIVRTLEASW